MQNSNFQNSKQKITKKKCLEHLNFCRLKIVSDLGFRISDLFVICLSAYLLICLLPKTVQAQTVSLSIWPSILEVQMMPGKIVTQSYRLTNNSDSFLEITPRVFPFEPDGATGQIKIIFSEPLEPDELFSFASGEKLNQPFSLKPQETKQLILKITLSKRNPQQDYHFTLLFATVAPKQNNKNQSTSVAQIGTNILLTASRVEKPPLLAKILAFSCPKIIDSFSSVRFNVLLENQGKTFWKPFGKIEIEGILKQKGEIKLLPQNVLAGAERKLDLPPFKPKLPLGLFKARLEFALNEEQAEPKLSAELSFWYLPYKLLLGLAVVITGLSLLRVVPKKKFSKESSPKPLK